MTNDINGLQEMFHNGSYAMCDDAMHTVAISMGYAADAADAGAMDQGRGHPRFARSAGGAPGGKNRASIGPLVSAPLDNLPYRVCLDFLFHVKRRLEL